MVAGTADFPAFTVEWKPASGPDDIAGTWVDMTSYVTGGATKGGRQYATDLFTGSTLTLTLEAFARTFDPDNAAGPYFGQLVPMRQIRIRTTWPTPAFSDSFNRADSVSTLGSTDSAYGGVNTAWIVQTGTWGISSNQAYEPGATAQATAVIETLLADTTIECTLAVVGDAGLCWRSTDTNNYWMWSASAGQIYKRVGGAFTLVATVPVPVNGDVVRVTLSGITHTVYINSVQVAQFTDFFNASATKHGLRSFSTAVVRFEDFKVGTITYPLWRGYITDWGQTTEQNKKYVTTLTCRDAFVRFEQLKLPSSPYALVVAADNPTAWFRLNETGTVRLTDTAGGSYGLYSNCQQGVTGLVVNDADRAASFAHSLQERVYIQNPNLITGFPFTITALIKVDSTDPNGFKVIFSGRVDPAVQRLVWAVASGAGGGVLRQYFQDASATHSENSDIHVDDNNVHHVAWVATSGSAWSVYIDGVLRTTTVVDAGTPSWMTLQPPNWVIGNYNDLGFGDFGFGSNVGGDVTRVNRGTIDEIAIWDGTALTAGQIATHSAAAFGWAGDDSGARVNRFLDAINWPASLRDISTGISTLGPASWSNGATALSVLNGWAATELGAFYIGPDGHVVWHSRHYPLLNSRATTSQFTFSDNVSGAKVHYEAVSLPRDEAMIRNPVSASRNNGITVIVKDAANITKYGDRTWGAPVSEDALDATVRDRATALLARYKELGTRLAGVTFFPREDATNAWPAALGTKYGDRITVEYTPLKTGGQNTYTQIVEAMSHTFTPFTWTTVFGGSPVDPGVNTFLILDDVTYGSLDAAHLAY